MCLIDWLIFEKRNIYLKQNAGLNLFTLTSFCQIYDLLRDFQGVYLDLELSTTFITSHGLNAKDHKQSTVHDFIDSLWTLLNGIAHEVNNTNICLRFKSTIVKNRILNEQYTNVRISSTNTIHFNQISTKYKTWFFWY